MKKVVDDLDAYSIKEFCRRHSISEQMFYKDRANMPDEFHVGVRVLISREAAAQWRARKTKENKK